jgi:hypothetical protein
MTCVAKVIICSADRQELLGSVKPTKGNAPAVAAAEAHQGTGRETDQRILHQVLPSEKAFATVRARLAFTGHTLIEKVHHGTGLRLWEVGRNGQARIYSHWYDVIARLSALGG